MTSRAQQLADLIGEGDECATGDAFLEQEVLVAEEIFNELPRPMEGITK